MISKISKIFMNKKDPMEEAHVRRQRTERILKAKNIPINEWLPLTEPEDLCTMRTKEEVCRRALALCLVAVKGEGLEQSRVLEVLDEYDIEPYLSPLERKFILEEYPSERDKIQFSWQYECYWVMIWALSYIEELAYPDDICNVPKALGIMVNSTVDDFIKNAKLRSPQEILDETDLIYRYHWAVRDATIHNREIPANLDKGVVMERHYALNWLTGYMDAEWDQVTADT